MATHDGTPVLRARRRRRCATAGRRARASSAAATQSTPSRASCSCGAARTRPSCSSGVRAADRASSTRGCLPNGVADRRPSTTAPIWSTRRCTRSPTTCSRARVLVTLVLFVFLLDLRAALIVAALIPLSLLSAFIYLQPARHDRQPAQHGRGRLRHHRRRRRGDHREHRPPAVAARPGAGADRMRDAHRARRHARSSRPTLFSLLIIIAAYLPIFMLQRVEGRIFAPMANTVVARWSARCSSRSRWCRCSRPSPSASRSGTASRRCCAWPQRGLRADAALGAAPRRRGAGRQRCWRWPPRWSRCSRAGLRVPARAQRGLALRDLHAALEHRLDRGPHARAAHHRDPRAAIRRSTRSCRSSAGPRTAPTRR